MNDQDKMEVYETMIHQEKMLLELKIQVESLKAMMFEHRPAFTDAFAQQVSKIMQTPGIQHLREQIASLEAGLNRQG
jgi:isochorismate synthase EntC